MSSSFAKWFSTDQPRFRGHRIQSIQFSRSELVEIRLPNRHMVSLMFRARQRTFEAAYWRTSLGQFSFALIILKIFQDEFYPIGGTPLEN